MGKNQIISKMKYVISKVSTDEKGISCREGYKTISTQSPPAKGIT
ncbi:hypothetical protein [Virgibacillus saliphilus]|nr:hypothetical protein [Virgibacillus sp. NKC19-3]